MEEDKNLTLFLGIAEEARSCSLCEAMSGRSAVLSELNGSLRPKVLFVAEAPGRQGADRTRRPFYGDKSGENFQGFLDSIGLSRDEIFITNTVLCSPRSATGANRRPGLKEIRNCSGFLRRTIGLIDPPVIASLGSVALEALKSIEYHQITLRNDAAKILQWNGRLLVPLYHPSPQVIASRRRRHEQLQDFQAVAAAIRASRG
jgi:uracil-DNA glycosylase